MKRNKLILLTSGFPYGNQEPFLETEINYLCKVFKQVQIIAIDPETENVRSVPENCSYTIIDIKLNVFNKINALWGLFERKTREELNIIRTQYNMKLNKGIVATLLVSLYRAKTICQQIIPFIEKDEDTILYSYWCDDSALALALLAEKRKSLKTICRMHGWDVFFERSALGYLPFRHLISEMLDGIFSISETGVSYAHNAWKVDVQNFYVSRLGVKEQTMLHPDTCQPYTIMSCSSLIPLKRVHLIAEAIKILGKNFNVRWVHIGDGPERSAIESVIKSMKPQIEVIITGMISQVEVLQQYVKYKPHVFINVSLSEGIPVSIMEAMSFGIPVIATDVGGTKEIVNDENGWLLSVNIHSAVLAVLLEKIYLEKQFIYKKKAAYETYYKNWNASVNYHEFIQMLFSI